MSLDRIEYVYTFGMTESEIAEALETTDVGVLALASDGAAYAIPVACYYDEPSLYFRLTTDGASKKVSYVDETAEACFTLYGIEPPDGSWSVVATGPIREGDEDAREAFDDATVNERFSEPRIFDEDLESIEWRLYELQIAELTGRKTGDSAVDTAG
jgi:uncharacterized protein